MDARETRFGRLTLPAIDPHGLKLAFVEDASVQSFTPWPHSPISPDHQIRGLFGARIWERDLAPTGEFLTSVLGFERLGAEQDWTRYGRPGTSGIVDVRPAPGAPRGAWGIGTVHHLAWRVADDAEQAAVRQQVETAGGRPTPVIDRFWFKSVYFREPGGVLFEIATDGPGFAADEDPAHLGERLVLPPWLEGRRAAIEQAVPPLEVPRPDLFPVS
jgi:glyoxalase family protein